MIINPHGENKAKAPTGLLKTHNGQIMVKSDNS